MITIYTGCMFSSKTYNLLKTYELKKENSILIKPNLDNREGFNFEYVTSRNNLSYKADYIINVDSNNSNELSLLKSIDITKIKNVFIDEFQFFTIKILSVINYLQKHNIDIYLSGLSKDSNNNNFGLINDIINIYKNVQVINLYAKCNECGSNASYTYRLTDTYTQICVGDKEYIPLCETHYKNKQYYKNNG